MALHPGSLRWDPLKGRSTGRENLPTLGPILQSQDPVDVESATIRNTWIASKFQVPLLSMLGVSR